MVDMKRSDLSTREILATVSEHRFRAFEALAAKYPAKVVQAALARDVRAGFLEYGVALERPWLTDAGRECLEAQAAKE